MPINEEFVRKLSKERSTLFDETRRRQQSELDGVLDRIEAGVVGLAAELPLSDGKLFDTQAAIEYRGNLSKVIQKELSKFKRELRPGYNEAVKQIQAQGKALDLPDLLTEASRDTIKQLRDLSFQGFDDLGRDFIGQLSKTVYDATLVGTPPGPLIKDLSVAVNGSFAAADGRKADDLVAFIKENRVNPEMDKQVTDAARDLHSMGRDVLGVNMRGRANQMVFDGLFQFIGGTSKQQAKEAGLDHYLYHGAIRKTSREWCVKHAGKVLSEEEIEGWRNQTWQGKAPGDPFIVRGGYNCRHTFMPVNQDWME